MCYCPYLVAMNSEGVSSKGLVVCFGCGHKYHASCLKKMGCVSIDLSKKGVISEAWTCYICMCGQEGNSPSHVRTEAPVVNNAQVMYDIKWN